MTAYRERLKAGEYDAKPAKATTATGKTTSTTAKTTTQRKTKRASK